MSDSRDEFVNRSWEMVRGGPPRFLKLKGPGKGRGLWTGAAYLLLLFLFFFILCLYNLLPCAAPYFGKKTMAQVLEKHEGESHGFKFPMMRVVYEMDGSTQYADIDSFSWDVYHRLQPGDRVAIHYLPAFTSKPSLDESPLSSLWLLGLLLPFIFPAVLFWWLGRDHRLLKSGWAVEGRVARMEAKIAWAQFQWKGKTFETLMGKDEYGGTNRPGDRVVVLVDPENPGHNRVYDENSCNWRVTSGAEDLID